MKEELLAQLVNGGLSISEISNKINKSKTSIRHWLSKYGLKTNGKAGAKTRHLIKDGMKICSECKENKCITNFRKRTDRKNQYSPYCDSCESLINNKNHIERIESYKRVLVNLKNDKCFKCNEKMDLCVYDFHHTEPEHKDFNLALYDYNSNMKTVLKELEKCILVCANCHSDIHLEMKQSNGYTNKINGNNEIWRNNRQLKLDYIKASFCENCGYNKSKANLCIIFPNYVDSQTKAKLRKYNRNYISKEFGKILNDSHVYCRNCLRKRIKNNSFT